MSHFRPNREENATQTLQTELKGLQWRWEKRLTFSKNKAGEWLVYIYIYCICWCHFREPETGVGQ